MRAIFADTSFFIALLNRRDSLHYVAENLQRNLGIFRLVTSEMVLTEFLDEFSGPTPGLRQSAASLVDSLQNDSQETPTYFTIVSQSHDQFLAAFDFYRSRPDKQWSLTDCASCLIMQAEGIQEALTHDKHFEQMGFKALLRADA